MFSITDFCLLILDYIIGLSALNAGLLGKKEVCEFELLRSKSLNSLLFLNTSFKKAFSIESP